MKKKTTETIFHEVSLTFDPNELEVIIEAGLTALGHIPKGAEVHTIQPETDSNTFGESWLKLVVVKYREGQSQGSVGHKEEFIELSGMTSREVK